MAVKRVVPVPVRVNDPEPEMMPANSVVPVAVEATEMVPELAMAPVRVVSPEPARLRVPALEMVFSRTVASLRFSLSVPPVRVMAPDPRDPDVDPDPICRVPADTVVTPEYEFAPVRVVVPVPEWVNEPVPEMAPATVMAEVEAKFSEP